ncbi:pyridoxamine 5'-phosphate oxidase family protein [Actinomadura rayongensis]|uniref:Pyridoxamine 5'-phosphate oxidase family protein n=1 Tax=Actinomadura rayongensis TaxID=1429076 RepID=A0A6I4W405_9ACTN|nr:pyridoxamine 5'-phosphate oxidase family protein [Actinomadura rayongensis]MXQ64907.1 pyridoxamine 5'-phosphate oxidase family protein [Actinomadura rayongensis]
MNTDGDGLGVLGHAECLALLRAAPDGRTGRIVFTDHALPAVEPVAFAVDGDGVIVRTVPGSRLERALLGAVVAFQVDEYDAASDDGWTVTLVGLGGAVPGRPGVRVPGEHVTGRRFAPVAGRPREEAS